MTPMGERSAADQRHPWRWWRSRPLLLCFALSLLLVAAVLVQRRQHDLAAKRQQLASQLSLMSSQLELTTYASFNAVSGLVALIQIDGQIDNDRFRAYTERVTELSPQVRSIAVAPDDVIRHIFPLKGNESALGLDYRSIPLQWQQVQQVKARHTPLVLAPVALVQGGLGVIQRTPVYLHDSAAGPLQRYWGQVSVVIDLQRLVEGAGLQRARQDLNLRLVAQEPDGKAHKVWGDDPPADADLVRTEFPLPGAVWALEAQPLGGWGSGFRDSWRAPEVLVALVALVLVNVLMFRLGLQSHEMRRRNEDLEASRARFRSMADLASDWVWEQDEQLRFTYVSRAAEEATETQSSGVIGHKRWDSPALVPGVDWAPHIAALERREPFRDFEYAVYAEDGSLRHVSISGEPIFDGQGRFRGYRGTGRNITPSKRAEAALRASQAELTAALDRLQAVLDAAVEVSIIATDMDGRIILANRGAERMLGYLEEELLGRSPLPLHVPEEVDARARQLSEERGRTIQGFETFVLQAREGGANTREWTYRRKDGACLLVSLSVSHVCSRDGQPLGYLGIAVDISAQRKAEQGLRLLNSELESRVRQRTQELSAALQHLKDTQDGLMRSEKLAALGSMVAGVSHELNTPLGNCLTTASTLLDRTQELRKQFDGGQMRRSSLQTYLDDAETASKIILRGLDTAAELVSHFKQLSVDQTSMLRRRFSVDSVVADVLSLMRARWRATPFVIEQDLHLTQDMEGYPGPLGQVLSNLLLNALIHGFEGRTQGRLRIEAHAIDDKHCLLIVEDDGVGMSEEVRRRAFDPFFTTKMGRGGTGLGLNIVHNLVSTVLGGTVSLQSQPGKGARFELRLPMVAPELGP